MDALTVIHEEDTIDDIINVRISYKLPQFDADDDEGLYYINVMSDVNVLESVIVDSSDDGSETSSRLGISLDKLYKNDGTNFQENWQERMIERHMLMKMQKEYRAQSAAHRRLLLDMRQKQKRKQLLGHRDFDGESGYFTRSEASLSLADVERANSVPAGYGGHHLPSTPVPPPLPRPQTQQETRVRSAFAAHKEQQRAELNSEMPFRLKMQWGSCEEANLRLHSKKTSPHIDPRLFDPRNPYNVRRPVSSKSIPSKCSHYVLVTHPKTGGSKVVPSPLEEQLIQDRFPQFKKKWLGNDGSKNRHFSAHGWT